MFEMRIALLEEELASTDATTKEEKAPQQTFPYRGGAGSKSMKERIVDLTKIVQHNNARILAAVRPAHSQSFNSANVTQHFPPKKTTV